MKNLVRILLITILFVNSTLAQQVIVSDDANYTTPASGAVLDVKSTSKGFLPPRVALNSLTDQTTVPTPSNGLMVYNTGAGSLADKGIYYWCDSIWVKPLSGGIGGANSMTISNDGTVLLHGSATTWTDLVVNPSTARNNGGTVPTWTKFVDPNIFTWMFSDAAENEVDFTVQMPHNYKEGSKIYPHVHWASTTAPGAQRVMWVLDYQWVNLDDVFSPSSSSTVYGSKLAVSDAISMAAYQSVITPMNAGGVDNAGIVGTGKKISSILVCHLYRQGGNTADTFTGVAALLSIDFHYEIDSFGSSLEYIK